MALTRNKRPDRKAKKSYTLSLESVELMRKRRRASLVSSVLEEILQGIRRSQVKAVTGKPVSEYYSSLAPGDIEEQAI